LIYKSKQISGQFSLISLNGNITNSFKDDVLTGLLAVQKSIPPKYFYDDKGSELFEKICSVQEYYVTRTESEILAKYSDDIAACCSGILNIVELGSGSSVKTRYMLSSFLKQSNNLNYFPIDVSDILISSGSDLVNDFSGLNVTGLIGEYEASLELAAEIINEPKLIIFLGSSIGNFDLTHAGDFIKKIEQCMKPGDRLLIGFDLVKDEGILNDAYNDKQGITAEFNLNLLDRINKELGGDFDPGKFSHLAFFNQAFSRIEMHLVSQTEQSVNISGKEIKFLKGETIHTENSYKFTDEMIKNLADSSGLKITGSWIDNNCFFNLTMFNK
jgi:dimethylhistidine N-methyltransferase